VPQIIDLGSEPVTDVAILNGLAAESGETVPTERGGMQDRRLHMALPSPGKGEIPTHFGIRENLERAPSRRF
jgi:hypothetical protein